MISWFQSLLSNSTCAATPRRSNNIKYASNEIYLDVIESIDATLDSEGRVLSSAIHGRGEDRGASLL